MGLGFMDRQILGQNSWGLEGLGENCWLKAADIELEGLDDFAYGLGHSF